MAEGVKMPKKKNKATFIILILILLILGLAALTVVNFYPSLIGLETKDKEEFTIETKQGIFSFGKGLPNDFPQDIPTYPGANPEGHFAGFVNFSTGDAPEAVNQFYAEQLKAKGWTVATGTLGNAKTVNGKKDDREVQVTATPDNGKTVISVIYAKK